MITPYHAKYFAYELTKRCSSDSMEKLAGAVARAQADLQVLNGIRLTVFGNCLSVVKGVSFKLK